MSSIPRPDTIAQGWTCKKRNGKVERFDCDKVRVAILGCFEDISVAKRPTDVNGMIEIIIGSVVSNLAAGTNPVPGVEHIQRLVIQQLWMRGMFDAAEAYQNYREERRKVRDRETAPIFTERKALKPFEYPDVIKFLDAIADSYWTHRHYKFVSDIQDFKVGMLPGHRENVRKALLAISQVEVDVKKFWARLGDRLRKPEFSLVGSTFAESESRHTLAYSHLLEILGLNEDFAEVLKVPAIRARIDYLGDTLKNVGEASDREYVLILALFSLFVENVSLFGQFYVIQSFHKHLGVLKDVDTVILATKKEETLHAMFGMAVINYVRKERPEWFDATFYDAIYAACGKAHAAELKIVDWIFESGEPPFLPKSSVVALIETRFNQSLVAIGGKPLFAADPAALALTQWFKEDEFADISTDFFHKRPVTYSRQSVTESDLF